MISIIKSEWYIAENIMSAYEIDYFTENLQTNIDLNIDFTVLRLYAAVWRPHKPAVFAANWRCWENSHWFVTYIAMKNENWNLFYITNCWIFFINDLFIANASCESATVSRKPFDFIYFLKSKKNRPILVIRRWSMSIGMDICVTSIYSWSFLLMTVYRGTTWQK